MAGLALMAHQAIHPPGMEIVLPNPPSCFSCGEGNTIVVGFVDGIVQYGSFGSSSNSFQTQWKFQTKEVFEEWPSVTISRRFLQSQVTEAFHVSMWKREKGNVAFDEDTTRNQLPSVYAIPI
ncbi:hypothetical protein KIN20_015580 [Parelaphostrongylus tenuis]|uniref:Uncharacterized protein n=1 Tax=Parelaphostrongylus tenuis TaxID=148309 RepID=A0AAD5QMC8_PARTN|nr:hypothetical protein KIN20_015580 [Parelaphostrongylus tenuis]